MSIGISVATAPGRHRATCTARPTSRCTAPRTRAATSTRCSTRSCGPGPTGGSALENLLRRALADDALVPVYQPIVDLENGRMHGAEALARILDGDRLVSPAEFIDVAEETGLIVEVDARMFERVAAEFARMLDSGAALRRLTTNVSARSLEDPCSSSGSAAHGRHACPVQDPGRAHRAQPAHREPSRARVAGPDQEIGIAVGLDDFGTGYSALAYLQTFPIAVPQDRPLVRSRLGATLATTRRRRGHRPRARARPDRGRRGRGDLEQLVALRGSGCDRAQGYLMGRPMPAAGVRRAADHRTAW